MNKIFSFRLQFILYTGDEHLLNSYWENYVAPAGSIKLLSIFFPWINIVQRPAPLTTRYYCAVFHFAHGSERVNILNGTDVACVATVLILCWKNKKIHRCTEELHKRRPQKTHEI